MNVSNHVQDIYLQPGELHIGGQNTRIRTVLGSCVSVVVWHPGMRVGGMCHFMLPSRGNAAKSARLDGRYGDEAISLLLQGLDMAGVKDREYQVKLFGGGNMFADGGASEMTNVGMRNTQAARSLISDHGLTISSEHLGGTGHRKIIFEVWSGSVWMRHVNASLGEQVMATTMQSDVNASLQASRGCTIAAG